MSTVGIIVNPNAGKDIRRLVTPATHTSDVTKVGIVRRAIVAATESGAERILLAPDRHRLAERAADGLDAPIQIVDEPITGSRYDTIAAARRFWKEQVGAIVALGGDGTSRDVALGWPDSPLVAVSTGTNNVFPSAIDGTSAGAAAGFVATGAVTLDEVGRRSKRILVRIDDADSSVDDVALVDLAFVDTDFIGARAVRDPHTVSRVVAAIATPTSTGLSSIAGRLHPVDRHAPGGVLVEMGAGERSIRVPLAPGSFTTMSIADVRSLADGEEIVFTGRTILAFDGERDRTVGDDGRVAIRIDSGGPILIDVDRTLQLAAERRLFDPPTKTSDHGDVHGH